MFIYPTKVTIFFTRRNWLDLINFPQALAQDQRSALEQLMQCCDGLQCIKVYSFEV